MTAKKKAEARDLTAEAQRGGGTKEAKKSIVASARPHRDFDCDVAKISPCPFQPRQDFSETDLQAFATVISEDGLLQPLVVRPNVAGRIGTASGCSLDSVDRVELVDGERRLRALKLLGRKSVPVRLAEYSDAEVRRIVLSSNEQARPLNAIEKARALQAQLDAGDAAGPTELAAKIGVSQGQVSNTLRLLKLPEAWQKRVISQEIPPTHARSIVRYAEAPAILAAIDKGIKDAVRYGAGIGTAEQFDEKVDRWAFGATEALAGAIYSTKLGKSVPIFTPTEEQRAQLDLVEVSMPRSYGSKAAPKTEARASNVKLWEKLQAEHEARLAARADKKGSAKETKGTKAAKPKPLTPAQQKQLEAQERQQDKDRAEKLAKGVWGLAIDWRLVCIAKAFRERQVSPEDFARVALYLVAGGEDAAGMSWTARLNALQERSNSIASRLAVRGDHRGSAIFAALRVVDDRQVLETALDCIADLIWHPENGPTLHLPDEVVLAITEQLAIDLTAEWKQAAAGELTERWLNLRNKEGLIALAKESGHTIGADTKAGVVHMLLKSKLKPPAELVKPKKPRG